MYNFGNLFKLMIFVVKSKRKFTFEHLYFVTIDNVHQQDFHEQKVIIRHNQEEAYCDGDELEKCGLIYLIHF